MSGVLRQRWKKYGIRWLGGVLGALILLGSGIAAQAQFLWPGHSGLQGRGEQRGSLDAFCRQPPEEVARKAQLRQRAAQSDAARAEYNQVLAEHRAALIACRSRRWPQIQAIWVRLHPCDANPGVLDQVFDQVVNLGYNRVFIETFYDGRSILPDGGGGIWPSLQPNADLLDLALKAARRRGLSAYAWVFSLNFGYSYGQRPDRQAVLARNGRGLTTVLDPATALLEDLGSPDEVFVDPFHPVARRDFAELIRRILQRQPDGILFDYIRYPRGSGGSSLAATVRDLWIHGEAARQAYLDLAENAAGRALLERYLSQGYVTVADVLHLDATYGEEPKWRQPGDPRPSASGERPLSPELWDGMAQGRAGGNEDLHSSLANEDSQPSANPTPSPTPSAAFRQERWQQQLWQLSVEFARYGILDYLRQAAQPAQSLGIPSGAVFFPDGNQAVGEGFDARLQPWDRFDPGMEWHPMAYAKCEDGSCVAQQVEQVLAVASPQTFVCPAIAGLWGQAQRKRPSLEAQMAELARRFPQLPCVSHFALSWIEPELERSRRTCQL
ncbi:hypothetical protein SYN63AY4M2_08000 [Synechococcus sp. 63AY4M2]|uniref:hypothetical protein n=1 Tax=unclassified Synechococcus TaxID=2626047 RepID=UPI000C18655C|nr:MULTISPECIES: hypothetical protein [unclassified Synechococcus]PIK84314.1 hypothetical protein SYN65AY6A5_13555 [Synechococcus sp. 65AY6A5]PIK95447.1 hypothetical protein SYN60AY4M2_08605 [Synechococcus sp. 60AY4M2]PIK97691.1 hypothetical protein SYN63AY4M1_06000 [Synechococcus sp. 63AY4M1]PIK86383.1 hypothetical protein SYN63AY4M2_08000 [Synechococcus sp. 63AY4M2]PIL01588.1 hypothetical protein SYN65AY640_08055 [Synechococcus sp. 65AY640]